MLTATPPDSCPLGPVAWPHQLFSALAPRNAVTPTPVEKSLSLTVSWASAVIPPDWRLEHSIVTAAPDVFTAGLPSFVKTLR